MRWRSGRAGRAKRRSRRKVIWWSNSGEPERARTTICPAGHTLPTIHISSIPWVSTFSIQKQIVKANVPSSTYPRCRPTTRMLMKSQYCRRARPGRRCILDLDRWHRDNVVARPLAKIAKPIKDSYDDVRIRCHCFHQTFQQIFQRQNPHIR